MAGLESPSRFPSPRRPALRRAEGGEGGGVERDSVGPYRLKDLFPYKGREGLGNVSPFPSPSLPTAPATRMLPLFARNNRQEREGRRGGGGGERKCGFVYYECGGTRDHCIRSPLDIEVNCLSFRAQIQDVFFSAVTAPAGG